jgi:integrase
MKTSFKFICRYDKKDSEGCSPIYLRVTGYYRVKYISAKLKIQPRFWNKNRGSVREIHSNHIQLNKHLDDFLTAAKERYAFIETTPKHLQKQSLIQFIDRHIHNYLRNNQLAAAQRLRTLKNKMLVFSGDASILDIDKKFILNFESYMRQNGNRINTIANNLSDLRTVLNKAVSEGLISSSPFSKGIKIKFERTDRRILSKDEVDRLLEANEKIKSMALDVFLLSFFAGGIRFADAVQLRWDSIKNDSIRFRMGKTQKLFSIPLLPEAQTILRRYKSDGKYVFPILPEDLTDQAESRKLITSKNSVLNRELKRIAATLDMEPFSFHAARHSIANYLLNKNVPTYVISKILRHSSLAVTERYLKDFDQELGDREFEGAFK